MCKYLYVYYYKIVTVCTNGCVRKYTFTNLNLQIDRVYNMRATYIVYVVYINACCASKRMYMYE